MTDLAPTPISGKPGAFGALCIRCGTVSGRLAWTRGMCGMCDKYDRGQLGTDPRTIPLKQQGHGAANYGAPRTLNGRGETERAIQCCLARLGTISARAVTAHHPGINIGTVYDVLKRMTKAGTIIRHGRDRYAQ